MRASDRLRLALTAALLALLLAVVPGVLAASVPEVQGPVTDRTGVLQGREDEIQEAIDELLRQRGVQLWVVFVPTTEGSTAEDYAEQVASESSLGGNDALLLVAVDDRVYYVWRASGLTEITGDDLDQINAEALEPRLREGDFAGAVVATARGLGDAAAEEQPEPQPGGGTTPDGGGFEQPATGGGGILLPLVLVVGGLALVGWWFMRRRAAGREAEERDRRTGRLAREANALLIATDERVRDAVQEIGFVEAEYGEEEVGPLRAAVAQARDELRAAFAVRQRLDDAEPETPQQREAMLNEIVTRSRNAQAALDKEAARIQQLRDLERDAPKILEGVPARVTALEGRLPASRAAFDALARYAPATRAPVAGNTEEAQKGIAGAREAAERGNAALAAGDRRAAGRQARIAEQGITGATALLDAVDKLAAAAADAEQRLAAELQEAATDLEAARSAARDAGQAPAASQITAAETALRQARAAASAVPLDPVAARRATSEAHRLADEALAAVRRDAEQHARFVAALDASLASAQADLDAAAAFIAAHRGQIGRRARTRLAEADRALETALALRETDPERAMAEAKRAERLAEQALDLADDEWDQWTGGMGGGGGRRRSSAGADMAGAILGGILGGVLSGGGRGGWGGSPWGSSGPFGGGGRSGGWGGPFGGGGGGGWGGGGFGRGGGFGGGGGGGVGRGGRW